MREAWESRDHPVFVIILQSYGPFIRTCLRTHVPIVTVTVTVTEVR